MERKEKVSPPDHLPNIFFPPNIFSALFILSSPPETLTDYMLDLSAALGVPEALFLLSLNIFSG